MKASLDVIHRLLPQTQCRECGFAGCLPYAQALLSGQAPINLCPPGGVETLNALGKALGVDPSPYQQAVIEKTRPPLVAKIDEKTCIGCTKCIQACPVDAILGTAKHMHAIITQECTGCNLCVEPCPVDCIEMTPIPKPLYNKHTAQRRFEAKQTRLLRERQTQEALYQNKRQLSAKSELAQTEREAKKAYILKAIQRAKKNECSKP